VFLTHTEVTGFVSRSDGANLVVDGVTAVDRLGGVPCTLRARVVVNAAGPWIDRVLEPLGRRLGVAVNRSKGVHVLTRPLGGPGRVDAAVFARAKSGKHVIVSPWMGGSFIGPTDTPLADSDSPVIADRNDVASILGTVNSTLNASERSLTADDVIGTTVGLRPLIRRGEQGDGGNTYSASRRHELYHHVDRGVANVWSIGGGKWTTARTTGEQMVDELLRHELKGTPARRFDSRRAGTSTTFAWAQDAGPFLAVVASAATALGLDAATGEHLGRLYGTEYAAILGLIGTQPNLARRITAEHGCLDVLAQAVYAVTDEGARTLADVIDRRLVLGTLGTVSRTAIGGVADVVGPLWGWDERRCTQEADAEFERRGLLERGWRPNV
jgi:glycerol-3-phosphate dehydrogenase